MFFVFVKKKNLVGQKFRFFFVKACGKQLRCRGGSKGGGLPTFWQNKRRHRWQHRAALLIAPHFKELLTPLRCYNKTQHAAWQTFTI